VKDILERDFDRCVERHALKVKLGIYVPIYKGWVRGVDEGENDPTFKYAAETTAMAEEIGIDSIWVADHLLNPQKGEREKSLEAWTTLTALAAITKKVELFHTTLCQGFRYPTVLAKMCATLDDVSNGRFRFALGAGWFKREFQSYGVPWDDDHDTRIDRAREQIEIIKALWTQPTTNYKGRFYEIVNGVLEPKPLQKPHPPIWWGGQSEKSRQLVADLADGWLMEHSTLKEAEEKVKDMTMRLQAKGRAGMKYAIPGRVFMGNTEEDAKRQVEKLAAGNAGLLKEILARDFVGSPQTIAERIHRLSEIGFDYVIFQPSPALKTLAQIEEKLIPIL
jgi:FMNH2-dependent dimethyl sulfone monooxygenase